MPIELTYDQPRGILVYQTPHADYLADHWPEAKKVNGHCVAIKANLKNIQILAAIEYPIPDYMSACGYDWPIERGRKPLAHQKLMANFLVANPHAFNLSDMGTMKTLATLWAADFIMEREKSNALIVAPLSVLDRVWRSAIFANFLGRRSCVVVHGNANERQRLLGTPADFYVINFDGLGVGSTTRKGLQLGGLSQDIYQRTDFRVVIIDEASAYRDARTKRHRLARIMVGNREYLWQLTGTPTPNAPTDAYGLARLAGTHKGESFGAFHNRLMMRVSQFKWIPRPGAYEEARKLLSPAIRYELADIWDGPSMTVQQRSVELTVEQRRAHAQIKNDLVVSLKSGAQITMANEASARLKFIQASLGAMYDSEHEVHAINAAPRLAILRELIEQAPSKLLCFVPLTSVVNMLYKELHKEINCAVVNGSTPPRERTSIFERFQQPQSDLRLLIADPGCMAHGLDLYAAQTVIWYGPTDRTELYLQANRRAYRPGQKHPVTIVQLVSNDLEREIFRRLEHNESMQGLLLDAVREGTL